MTYVIDNIIFDWAGTLNDSVLPFFEFCESVFEMYGRIPPPRDEMRGKFTLEYMKFWNHYFPDMTKDEQKEIYLAKMPATRSRPKLYSSVPGFLERMQERGMLMGILSSDPEETIMKELKEYSVGGSFVDIRSGVYDKSSELPKMLAENCFDRICTAFVGDMDGDIKAGKAAGVLTVAVTWGYNSRDVLERHGPDIIIDDIAELEDILM